jgi:ankyrin repeat protein
MQLLRRVDSNNYQLELSRPFTGSIKLIAKHDSFRDWRDLGPKAPNLLYVWTPQGIGSAAIASHLIETLGTSIPDYTIISFSFNKQDLRTQPITTFYVSLFRQLLLSQLSLFRRVSAIGDWIKGEENLSYEIFRSLFLSLLKGASPNPVICILHAVQDCAGFPLDHIVDLIKEFRRLSKGLFKVILLSEEPVHGAFVSHSDVCRDIDLSTTSWSVESVAGYVRSRVGTLAKTRPHWRGCENEITKKLCRPSVTYTQATTSLRLLNSKNIPSTRSGALDAIEQLPLSGDEIYAAAVDHCESECPLSLKPLLQWVLHSVRPLSMNELAVVIGLANQGSSSMETLRPNIPLDILGDLRQVNGTLIETVGLQAVPVHRNIVPVLDEKWHRTDEDADSVMLCTCLDYLEMILVNIPTISLPPGVRGTSRSSRSSSSEPPPEDREQNRSYSLTKGTKYQSSEVAANKQKNGSANPPANGISSSPKPPADEEKREEENPRLNFDLALMLGLEYDLLEYAVTSWPEHYKRARNKKMVKDRILGLFSKNHEVQAWSALYQKFSNMDTEKFETLDSLFNIGCRFGLLDIVKDVIGEVKASKTSKDALSEALDLAVGFGHEDIVFLLILEGAESNEAPSLAAEYGFLDILQQLINANPTMANMEDKFRRPPFLLAALSGNENIASYLMAKGAKHTAAGGNSITALQVAAMTGQLGLLRKLLDAGSDIHATLESTKSSALMLAAAGGFDDIATLLLSRGARINDRDSDGETALHRAVKHGHASTCYLLFAAGADIHIKTDQGLSPIHIASSNGYLGILQELLARSKAFLYREGKSADIKVRIQAEEGQINGEGQAKEEQANRPDVYDDSVGVRTPLELAVSNGYLDIMRELLKYPRYDSEKSRATALLIAASGGFPQLVEELLKTGITTVIKDTNGNNALHLATQEQYPDIIASLLRSDSELASIFDVNAQNNSGWTPLHLAALSGRLITVQTLLHSGASVNNVNLLGETALHIASCHNHVWVVNALLDHLTDHPTPERNARLIQDFSDDTAFIIAVRQGHYTVASALIEKSAPLQPMELQGQKNALIESAGQDHPDLAKLLLDHGWDVNARDKDGDTALHLAADCNLLSIMELLISRGADYNAHNKKGKTPLHRAIGGGKLAIQTLLEKGADINVKDDEGTTPLWRASYRGKFFKAHSPFSRCFQPSWPAA